MPDPLDLDRLDALAGRLPATYATDLDVFDEDSAIAACIADPALDRLLTIDTGIKPDEPNAWKRARESEAAKEAADVAEALTAFPVLVARVRTLEADLAAARERRFERDYGRDGCSRCGGAPGVLHAADCAALAARKGQP